MKKFDSSLTPITHYIANVITSVFDELYPMITLKHNQVFKNQNLLDVSSPRIILSTKHVTNFWGLTASFAHLHILSRAFTTGNMYNQSTESFTRGGIYPCLLLPDTSFSCSANSGTPLNFVQRYTRSLTTKNGV